MAQLFYGDLLLVDKVKAESNLSAKFHFNYSHLEQCLNNSLKKATKSSCSSPEACSKPLESKVKVFIWTPALDFDEKAQSHLYKLDSPSKRCFTEEADTGQPCGYLPPPANEVVETKPFSLLADLLLTKVAHPQELGSACAVTRTEGGSILPFSMKYRGGPAHHETDRVCIADGRWKMTANPPSVRTSKSPSVPFIIDSKIPGFLGGKRRLVEPRKSLCESIRNDSILRDESKLSELMAQPCRRSPTGFTMHAALRPKVDQVAPPQTTGSHDPICEGELKGHYNPVEILQLPYAPGIRRQLLLKCKIEEMKSLRTNNSQRHRRIVSGI
jgi:hypothetical protein